MKKTLGEKYRAGIIGCGLISGSHAEAFQKHKKVNLVAAADINSEALEKFVERFSVSSKYISHREMLKKENLDIVSVCTWPHTHAEITIAAAESGVRGVLCEKPMGVNLGEAEAMLDACDKSGAKLAIGYHLRFHPVVVATRQIMQEDAIGKPVMVSEQVGDGLSNLGSHAIDSARYILGDPETEWVIGQVERKTDRYERHCRIEDLCMGLICFTGGTRVVIECNFPDTKILLPFEDYSRMPRIHGVYRSTPLIYGTEGLLKICEDEIFLLNGEKLGWQKIKLPSTREDEKYLQLAELIAWMEGKIEEHRSSGGQAIHTTEIMMAIYESLRVKGLVHMPLRTKESPLELMIDDGTLPVEKLGEYDIRGEGWLRSEKG